MKRKGSITVFAALSSAVEHSLIFHVTSSCQAGKGPFLTMDYVKAAMEEMYYMYGTDWYVFQYDMEGYFDNIGHKAAKMIMEEIGEDGFRIGRAARNSEGHVIMYADKITDSMRVAIDETKRRRKLQQAYNEEHGITPKTIQKSVRDLIAISKKVAAEEMEFSKDPESMSRDELEKLIGDIQKKMKKAAAELNFEAAAEYRDKMVSLKNMLREMETAG